MLEVHVRLVEARLSAKTVSDHTMIGKLSPLQILRVKLAMAVASSSNKVIICDNPTMNMTADDTKAFLSTLMKVADTGRIVVIGFPSDDANAETLHHACSNVIEYEVASSLTYEVPIAKDIEGLVNAYIPPTASVFTQFQLSLGRSFRFQLRNVPYTALRFIALLFFALYVGLLFNGMNYTLDLKGTSSGAMFYFLVVVINGIIMINLTTEVYMEQIRPVVERERRNGSLIPEIFVLSQVISEIPFIALIILSTGSIVYFMAGMPPNAARYFFFFLILFEVAFIFSLYSFFIAFFFPCPKGAHMRVAGVAQSVVVSLNAILAGALVPLYVIPIWWDWLRIASPLSWAVKGLAINWVYCDIPNPTVVYKTSASFLSPILNPNGCPNVAVSNMNLTSPIPFPSSRIPLYYESQYGYLLDRWITSIDQIWTSAWVLAIYIAVLVVFIIGFSRIIPLRISPPGKVLRSWFYESNAF